jgi:hypothetical protein
VWKKQLQPNVKNPSDELKAEADELRKVMHRLIGETLNSFNILEDFIRTCIANLLNIDDVPVIETLFGKLGSKQLIDTFDSLAITDTSDDVQLDEKRKKVLLRLTERAKERNMVVHAIWGIEFVNNESVGMYHTRYTKRNEKNPYGSISNSFSEKEFRELIAKAEETYILLASLRKDILQHHPRIRGSH